MIPPEEEPAAGGASVGSTGVGSWIDDWKPGDPPPVLPGDASDNPALFGDDEQAGAAGDIFQRLFKRAGGAPKAGGLMALRARSPAVGQRGGGRGMAGRMGARGGGGGYAGDESDSDADDSESDEDNAFATKAFAAMGSTGKIVPLNRDIIRTEADSAVQDRLGALLDEKLKAFDDSKRELLELQASLTEKIRLLEQRGGGGGGSALAVVPERGLPSGWSEVFDEASQTT